MGKTVVPFETIPILLHRRGMSSGWASWTRPGYRRQRICNDGHGMGSFSHAFVPLPTILPRSCKKNGTLALCDQKKKKNNKPTKKKNLGGPFMYRLKNNNNTTTTKKICYLYTTYIRCTSISLLIPHWKKNHKNFIMHSKKIKEKKIKYCTIKRIHFIMDNLIKRKNA